VNTAAGVVKDVTGVSCTVHSYPVTELGLLGVGQVKATDPSLQIVAGETAPFIFITGGVLEVEIYSNLVLLSVPAVIVCQPVEV
jgi:hypothetical protein